MCSYRTGNGTKKLHFFIILYSESYSTVHPYIFLLKPNHTSEKWPLSNHANKEKQFFNLRQCSRSSVMSKNVQVLYVRVRNCQRFLSEVLTLTYDNVETNSKKITGINNEKIDKREQRVNNSIWGMAYARTSECIQTWAQTCIRLFNPQYP